MRDAIRELEVCGAGDTVVVLSEAERAYLVRAIDLGRGDDEARGHLCPVERDELQKRLGGRPV